MGAGHEVVECRTRSRKPRCIGCGASFGIAAPVGCRGVSGRRIHSSRVNALHEPSCKRLEALGAEVAHALLRAASPLLATPPYSRQPEAATRAPDDRTSLAHRPSAERAMVVAGTAGGCKLLEALGAEVAQAHHRAAATQQSKPIAAAHKGASPSGDPGQEVVLAPLQIPDVVDSLRRGLWKPGRGRMEPYPTTSVFLGH